MATSTPAETVPAQKSTSRELEAARTAAAAGLAVAAPPISMNRFPVDLEIAFDDKPKDYDLEQSQNPLVYAAFTLIAIINALDITIVSVSLPTIVKDLNGERGYSWVGVNYLLLSACAAPLYPHFSRIFGRKEVLLFSIILHLAASALSGCAGSYVWLALSRGLQGIAAGGMVVMTMNTIVDINPSLSNIGKYSALLSFVTGLTSVVGPFIGAAFTQQETWRLCFWINLPIGSVAFLLLLCFLRLDRSERQPIRDFLSTFDFLGLFLLMAGSAVLLVGFEEAQVSRRHWQDAASYAPIVVGGLLIITGIIYELRTDRDTILPKRLFQSRTTVGIVLAMLILSMVSAGAAYYLPLYFQILGASPLKSAAKQFAFVCGSMLTSVFINPLMWKTAKHRPFAWAGGILLTVGYGLMIMLEENTPQWKQEIILLVAGIGIGFMTHPLFAGLESGTPLEHMGKVLSAASFVRMLGGTIGISVGSVVFSTELRKRLSRIEGVSSNLFASEGAGQISFVDLSNFTPETSRQAVLHAHTRSMATVWIVFCALSFAALLCVLPIHENGVWKNRMEHELSIHAASVMPSVSVDPTAVSSPAPIHLTKVPKMEPTIGSPTTVMGQASTNATSLPLTRPLSDSVIMKIIREAMPKSPLKRRMSQS